MDIESVADDILGSLTVREKIGQLNLLRPASPNRTGSFVNTDMEEKIIQGLVGGISGGDSRAIPELQKLAVENTRHGIPLLFYWNVIHGYRTGFPLPIGLACSWDAALVEEITRIAAIEATADGFNWAAAPVADITRNPVWGRTAEGLGEDPVLCGRLVAAMVKGFQGDDLTRHDTMIATLKHYAAYGAAEAGKEYNTVDLSPLRLHEVYLPPFEMGVQAGALCIMPAFNDINGLPASAHKELLTTLLRQKWGFTGFLVSDYNAIPEMSEAGHGTGNLATVAANALGAGLDMELAGESYIKTLEASLANGMVSTDDIDNCVRRIIRAKLLLYWDQAKGRWDPYRYISSKRQQAVIAMRPAFRQKAREAAARSCVLLKNERGALPIGPNVKAVALIGPLADDKKNLPGTWSLAVNWRDCVSVREGLREALGSGKELLYAPGANLTDDPLLAANANVFGNTFEIDPDPEKRRAEALEVAVRADRVVIVVGESKEMSGECSSRTDIRIPRSQRELIKAIVATGKPVVLVVMSGRPLDLSWEHEHAAAILWAPFGGVEAGTGIADLLVGNQNPSGKLAMTFPRHIGQVPIFYSHRSTGRPLPGSGAAGEATQTLSERNEFVKFHCCYMDRKSSPLYAFGHGLSYSGFEYSDLRLSGTQLHGEDAMLQVSVRVKNTGSVPGREVVQMYLSGPRPCSITRPIKELKEFQSIELDAGEEKGVRFRLTTEQLAFSQATAISDCERVWEGGRYCVGVGGASDQLKAADFVWEKE